MTPKYKIMQKYFKQTYIIKQKQTVYIQNFTVAYIHVV